MMAIWEKVRAAAGPLLQAVAPTLGGALGGPLGAVAGRVLAEALTGDADAGDAAVAERLATGDPQVLLALRQAEARLQEVLTAAGVDLERIASADRADARKLAATTGDVWSPRVLGVVVVAGFLAAGAAVLLGAVDTTDPTAATLVGAVVGYASAKADQVVSYWFGSSAGSKAKSEEMAAALRRGGAS